MADALPAEVQGWIGKERYPERSEIPVEQSYIWTTCSSVEMGNPIYWDAEVASEITDGPIAPPSMDIRGARRSAWASGWRRSLNRPLTIAQHATSNAITRMEVNASARNFGVLDCERMKKASTTSEAAIKDNTTLRDTGDPRPTRWATMARRINPPTMPAANNIARKPCSVAMNMNA